MKRVLVIFTVLFLAGRLFAGTTTITLSNAIELAILNNLDIKKARQEVGVAEAQFAEAIAGLYMPSISAMASYTEIDPISVRNSIVNSFEIGQTPNPAFLNLPITPDILTNVYPDNYSTGISITKTLFAGFRLWNSQAIKEAALDLAREKLDDTIREVTSSVTLSFYNLMLIRENIKMNEDLTRSLKERADYTRKNYKAGNATEYDSIRSDVQYNNYLLALTRVKNSYKTSVINFCQQIGEADTSNVEFIGSIYDTTNIVLEHTNEAELIDLALSNSIAMKEENVNMRISELQEKIVDSMNVPTLSAFFNYDYNYQKTNQTLPVERTWNPSWNAGIQLSWSLDSLIPVVSRNYNSHIEAEKTKNIFEIRRQKAHADIILMVQTFLIDINQSSEDIKSQEANFRQAQLGYRLAGERYASGISSEVEVLDAEAAMSQAESGYLESILQYFSSMLKMKRLIGE